MSEKRGAVWEDHKERAVDEIRKHVPREFSKPVDLVLTWVNGSDQSLVGEMLKFKKSDGNVSPNRFRDWGTLKYALRSVETYADWFNHVYIVTNGQVPSWLNVNYHKVSIVKHSDIFKNSSHLPTFNAGAIAVNIHRIPGLLKHFIYMNDDFFFANKVQLSDFYTTETGFKIRFGAEVVPDCSAECKFSDINNGICDTSCNSSFCEWDGEDCHTVIQRTDKHSVIDYYGDFFGSLLYTAFAFNKAFGFVRSKVPAHVPYIIDIETVNELQNRFPEEWERTSASRFRNSRTFQYNFAYYHYLLRQQRNQCGREIPHSVATTYRGYKDYTYSHTGNATDLEKRLTYLLHKKHVKFACINDHMYYKDDVEEDRNRKVVSKFFEEYFPNPSSFEVK